MKLSLYQDSIDSPLGKLWAIASNEDLMFLTFSEDSNWVYTRIQKYYHAPSHLIDWGRSGNSKVISLTKRWLENYFSKKFNQLTLPKLDPQGSSFSMQIWKAMLSIDLGNTQTYGQLAKKIKKPQASRAVGQAVGANPIVILIPCHRVLGGEGKLTGYRNGLDRKVWLLNHEGF